jgi:ubiquinone/menaquinone biosynthesis C-methylase UbiE
MTGTTPLEYARWRGTALGAVTERLERAAILDLAGPLAGRDVLDIGCGDGAYALRAARAGARVTGVDRSAAVVEAARRRAADAGVPLELHVADARTLPLPAERFDVVLAVTVLCFVLDPALAVAEMARVLRPGGVLVLGELGRWSTWGLWRRLRAWAGSTTWRTARFWSPAELRSLLRQAGLAPGRERGAAYYPPVGSAARLLERVDPLLGRATRLGAAFIAIAGRKPAA